MLPSRAVRVFAVALLAVLVGTLLQAAPAQAAQRTVQGGRLDWGIKSSFQRYVTGPIAGGSWSLTGGAATFGGSQFRFHSASGSYDPDTGAFESGFLGGVRFTGHRKADGSYELDLTISRPTVRISGGRGTLHLDMVSRSRSTGKVTSTAQVAFAALNLSGIGMKGGSSPVRLNNVPSTLTAQGAKAFAGYYAAGTPLDPVTLSADLAAARQPKPSQAPTKKTGPDRAPGVFRDAAVDWGVRRTFREYVSGPVADGRWALSGGAQDGGALFRFPGGKGTYDAGEQVLDASFAGAVRFTGRQLDLTLAHVRVRVRAGKGTLSADVTAAGRTDTAVPLIVFSGVDFTPKNGLARLTEAPATLTEGGAKAFGGMYEAGTAMDPVSLAVAVGPKAHLPALPDLGSDVQPAPTPTGRPATTDTTTAAAPAPAAAGSSSGTGTYIAAGAAVFAAAAAGVLYAVRRRRTSQN
ncbi:HtaA domain-containing protein [Streptomyces sp. NPDC002187]|uniref:HtaA domain-containing protein n=1 Tax=Streptomyces sp. NPDC002187 TaxID=3364637 RepID=UPI0036A5571F